MNKKQGLINRDVNAAERARMAVQLRAQRLTFEQIAAQAGYASPGAARNAIQRELQRNMVQDTDHLRREELAMLDLLHAAIWPMAVPPDDAKDAKGKPAKSNLFAVDRIIQISERRAKLMGLDVPVSTGNVAANMVVVREVPSGYLGEVKS